MAVCKLFSPAHYYFAWISCLLSRDWEKTLDCPYRANVSEATGHFVQVEQIFLEHYLSGSTVVFVDVQDLKRILIEFPVTWIEYE
jgi:hypothetical protein